MAQVVFAAAHGDVELVPLSVAGQTGFEVLNALRIVRCVDEARSEFIKWTKDDHRADLAGQYRQITRLRLDTDAIPEDADLFLIESWRVALIVSDVVKDAMEHAGCLGAKFAAVT